MRLDFDVRPSNPPAPLLQATFFDTLRKPFLIFPCGETTCVWIFDVRPSNPPFLRFLNFFFNFSLRRNNVRLDFDVRPSNPPAPLLQATFFDDTLRKPFYRQFPTADG